MKNIFEEIASTKVISVGKRIRHLRQRQRASQETIAKELGISIPAFSKIETGYTDINISRLFQIAALFNVTPESLVLDDDKEVIRLSVAEYEVLKERIQTAEGAVIKLQGKLISCYER